MILHRKPKEFSGYRYVVSGNLETIDARKKSFTKETKMAYDIDKVIHEYGDIDFGTLLLLMKQNMKQYKKN